MKLKTAYDNHDQASLDTAIACKDKTLTQQHFKDECDINVIVERFGLTGEIPHVVNIPTYGDFEGIFDFQTAMNTVRAAEEAFMTLPAKMRARFNNQPHQLLEFLNDDENRDEAVKLGLLNKPEPSPQPAPAPSAPAPATPPAVPPSA